MQIPSGNRTCHPNMKARQTPGQTTAESACWMPLMLKAKVHFTLLTNSSESMCMTIRGRAQDLSRGSRSIVGLENGGTPTPPISPSHNELPSLWPPAAKARCRACKGRLLSGSLLQPCNSRAMNFRSSQTRAACST